MLPLGKKEAETVKKALAHWQQEGLLDESTTDRLQQNIQPTGFDWQKLAFYAFLFAVGSVSVGVLLLLADEWILSLIERLVDAPNWFKGLLLIILATGLYLWGLLQKKRHPQQVYTNEAFFLLGAVATAAAAVFIGMELDNGSGHFSLLILVVSASYALIAFALQSIIIWTLFLISFSIWFGSETGYLSQWEGLFWGMNYPLRFVLFSGLMAGASFLLKPTRLARFQSVTFSFGLLLLFLSLWLLSIFGNFTDLDAWGEVRQFQLWGWAVLMALISGVVLVFGLKTDDNTSRDLSIIFLLVNLLTRYVEYGWETLHKAIFFMILGLFFWLLGKKAETLWNLGRKKTGKHN